MAGDRAQKLVFCLVLLACLSYSFAFHTPGVFVTSGDVRGSLRSARASVSWALGSRQLPMKRARTQIVAKAEEGGTSSEVRTW